MRNVHLSQIGLALIVLEGQIELKRPARVRLKQQLGGFLRSERNDEC